MSNGQSVMLNVYSVIKMNGEEDQVMELMTEGKFFNKNGSRYFLYEESDVSGMNGDKTTLKLSGNQVVMHRYGQNNSELCFEEGKRFDSTYNTPYGPFQMEVLASKVFHEIDDTGNGSIHLIYELSMKGIGETKTTMKILSKATGEV